MNTNIIEQWKKDERAKFTGWDFSYLKDRYSEGQLNWNYISIAKTLVKKANAVLDLATGGGEVFSEILSEYHPKKVFAIEGYEPNISVAKSKLSQFGALVVFSDPTKNLPFRKEEFDLVLNRHGGFNVNQLARILSPRGLFLTQQVDGRNLLDLMKEFGSKPKWEKNKLPNVVTQLSEAGFEIMEAKEWTGKTTFKDVGAIVYYLKAIPWIVDNFSIKEYAYVLEKLQHRLDRKGELCFTSKSFLVLARRVN